MIDISHTTVAKSTQQNADDYLAGPRIIKITRIELTDVSEQPVAVFFEGDDGKPYLPCKTCRRVMMHVWGKNASAYVGRSMTIFRDSKVRFGAMEVGGIRISHMSHIESDMTFALNATKGKKALTTVKPLTQPSQTRQEPQVDLAAWADGIVESLPSYATADDLRAAWSKHRVALKDFDRDRYEEVSAKVNARGGELSVGAD